MSAQSLLEQLLKSGLNMIQTGGSATGRSATGGSSRPSVRAPSTHLGMAAGTSGTLPNALPSGSPGGAGEAPFAWGTFGAGTAVGGALGLLLGSKRGRRYGGKALKVGSVAALGALAYKAYTAYQERQPQVHVQAQPQAAATPAPTPLPLQMIDRVPEPEVERHSLALLKAMVGAAKADGHIDERERALIEAELQRLGADPSTRQMIDAELRRPLDPADIARSATSPELAAEVYLASLLIADDTNTMERLYLDELARQLALPEGLKAELESQIPAA